MMRKAILIISLIVSLLWIYFIPNEPISDPSVYFRTAQDLAAGKGYIDDSGNPWAYWAPGYAFYLAFFFKLFGSTLDVAFVANWIAYLALVTGVYVLTSTLYSRHVGLLAAILTALYPTFIFYNTILASEIVFNALAVWVVYGLWRCYGESKNYLWIVITSILIAFTMLVRAQAMIFPLIALAIIPIRQFPRAKGLLYMMLITILSVGICVPWGIRNYAAFGKFVLVSANFGANLWIGNHDGANGSYIDPQSFIESEGISHLPITDRDVYLKNKALKFIQENPLTYLKLMGKRFFVTMQNETIGVVWNRIGLENYFGKESLWYFKALVNLCYYTFLFLFLYSLFMIFFKSAFEYQDLLIIWVLIINIIPFLLIIGQDRYHLPLIPFMIILIAKTFEKRRVI